MGETAAQEHKGIASDEEGGGVKEIMIELNRIR
jgi:hypothetical protein